MPLNLITDAWIPVSTTAGARIIRPDQIAEMGVLATAWPRPDLNIACLEFLVGLVFLACPPEDDSEDDDHENWKKLWENPDPEVLRDAFAPFTSAFELGGDGPRFCQDREGLTGDTKPPDMLFIDSAGDATAKKNADLMVQRGRYTAIPAPLAAMALFTLQSQAPSGGAGNRTSMRGGGPMITLVDPGQGLWRLVWANVPYGTPGKPDDLPWMRDTKTSEKGKPQTYPPKARAIVPETFFGMPRRLRLVFDEDMVTGVIQRPYGTDYAGWDHPLTPYYRSKPGDDPLPRHPKPGMSGYREWLGIAMQTPDELRQPARVIRLWGDREAGCDATLLVAGWAMSNMSPLDFILSHQPLAPADAEAARQAAALVMAANALSRQLYTSLVTVCGGGGEEVAALREAYFTRTEAAFQDALSRLAAGEDRKTVGYSWIANLRRVALELFEGRALPRLGNTGNAETIVKAHGTLRAALNGRTKVGAEAFMELGLPVPEKTSKANKRTES